MLTGIAIALLAITCDTKKDKYRNAYSKIQEFFLISIYLFSLPTINKNSVTRTIEIVFTLLFLGLEQYSV